MVRVSGQNPVEFGLRIDVVQLGGLGKSECDCNGFGSVSGACELLVSPGMSGLHSVQGEGLAFALRVEKHYGDVIVAREQTDET